MALLKCPKVPKHKVYRVSIPGAVSMACGIYFVFELLSYFQLGSYPKLNSG